MDLALHLNDSYNTTHHSNHTLLVPFLLRLIITFCLNIFLSDPSPNFPLRTISISISRRYLMATLSLVSGLLQIPTSNPNFGLHTHPASLMHLTIPSPLQLF